MKHNAWSATHACRLQGDSCTDAFRCVEMREGTPWLWQADAYGVAACAHTLLHGRYMQVERVRDSCTGGSIAMCVLQVELCCPTEPHSCWPGPALHQVGCTKWPKPRAPHNPHYPSAGVVSLRPVQPLKRQWACELWGAFFRRLLNHSGATALIIVRLFWLFDYQDRGSSCMVLRPKNPAWPCQPPAARKQTPVQCKSTRNGCASLPDADPHLPPAVDDLVAGFEAYLSGNRDVAQRLRRELAVAAAALPQRC